MTTMLRTKMDEASDLKIESVMVEIEYRLGMNDPSRTAAQFEKKLCMMKNIGKKSVVNEYIKRVNRMKDH